MLRTLYAKLALVLLLLLGTLGVLYGTFTLYASHAFLQELDQRFNRDLARQLLVNRDLGRNRLLTAADTEGLFAYYMHINPAIEIYLLDAAGRIQAFAAPEQKVRRERVALAPIRAFLSGAESYPILGDDPRHPSRRKVFSAAEIHVDGELRQYLYVVLGGEAYDDIRTVLNDSYYLRLSTTAAGLSVVFGVLAGLVIFFLLTRRLRRLGRVMGQFRESGFRRHEPYGRSGGDEIDQLGSTFDAMAERIIEQVRALEAKDSLRRNLVANVSHDLRTPLASLQGYLETLQLKADSLAAQERERYLDVAFRQSERLTRLVAELFELSKLEANEARPVLEPVAVGELLADVAQQYQLEARQRGVGLEAAIGPDLPLVAADMAMLARVLENLTENALSHTPAGGWVHLAARADGGDVEVTVANSGPGIAEQDLPHVFDRFYQAPERRGKGAGLGLAIVSRILELHGSRPRVDSVPGERTRFRFVLHAGTQT